MKSWGFKSPKSCGSSSHQLLGVQALPKSWEFTFHPTIGGSNPTQELGVQAPKSWRFKCCRQFKHGQWTCNKWQPVQYQYQYRIWKSSIRLETKLHLYQTYIVPVLMYWCKTLATTKYLLSRLDAFDTGALRKILRIPYTRHVSNAEVRRTTGCSPLSHVVTNRRLRLFGHIARSSSREDHHRALAACIRQVPPDWKRPCSRKT